MLDEPDITSSTEGEHDDSKIFRYGDHSISFHGNVTAFAYGIDHLILDCVPGSPSKLRELGRLLQRQACLVETLDSLPQQVLRLREGYYPVERPVYSDIVRRVDAHFDYLADTVERSRGARHNVSAARHACREHRALVGLLRARLSARLEAAGEIEALPDQPEALTPVTPPTAAGRAPFMDLHRQLLERDKLIRRLVVEGSAES